MANQQSHIVLKIYGDVDLDFALVPVTEALVKAVIEHVHGLQALGGGKFVRAEFWNGAPVSFETPDNLEGLLDQVTDEGYKVITGRPDVHWRHFKRTDCIRLVVQRDRDTWEVYWTAYRGSAEFHTAGLPLAVIAALSNPYLKPECEPFAALADGTSLYPAHYPPRHNERYGRAMNTWNGTIGEWVGVTLDGRLFRQHKMWGNDSPRPDKWEEFRVT